MNQDFLATAAFAFKFFLPFLFALCFHEFAHGFVAKLKGDRTAEIMGRLTLNPIAHADPLGTVLLPLISIVTGVPLFGWAKPVPVDPRNFRRPKQDMFWVAAAGPLSNVLLAVVGTLILTTFFVAFPDSQGMVLRGGDEMMRSLKETHPTVHILSTMLPIFLQINLLLALFNLIPIHPLDGGKILARFIPDRWNQTLEENQTMLSIALFAFVMMFAWVLSVPVSFAVHHLMIGAYSLANLIH